MEAMYIVQVHGSYLCTSGIGFLASTVVAIVSYQLIELHIIITSPKFSPKRNKLRWRFCQVRLEREMSIFRGEGVVGGKLTTNHIGW